MSENKVKQPVNLLIQADIREWGEILAKQDHRSLSCEVEWLIEHEYKLRQIAPESKQAA